MNTPSPPYAEYRVSHTFLCPAQARAGEARVQDELWTTQTRVDTHGRQLIQELHIARSEVPLRAEGERESKGVILPGAF